MDIYLHNTLSGQKEKFTPLVSGVVKMYNCGPTVYFFPTIGNMRSYVFADTIRRTLESRNYKVEQVINITDVGHLVGDGDTGEDKVETTAKKEGKTPKEIASFYEQAFYKDLKDLNIDISDIKFPKASEHITEQIGIIKILEEKGITYKTSDGVYFDTSKFPEYGKLGKINLEGQEEGARIGVNKEKKNKTDFALWKFSQGEKRLQEWESPWGIGFPGWHIECSAMSRKYLGQPFDIHTGGIDHIPVHHNNEIAQSEGAFGVPLSNIWMHNEFISIEGQKMSKSLGNTFTLSDLKERKIHPLSFRYLLLSAHYRSPMNFTWESVYGAQTALENVVVRYSEMSDSEDMLDKGDIDQFEEAIADDLNTPIAIAILQKATHKSVIDKIDRVLGLNIKELSQKINEVPEEIKDIEKERETARANKDWRTSDELRMQIESKGFVVLDKETGTKIRRTLASMI